MANEFRFCSECGESLRAGASFCGVCGASIPTGDGADGGESEESSGQAHAATAEVSPSIPRRRRRGGLVFGLVSLAVVAAGLSYIAYGTLVSAPESADGGGGERRGAVSDAPEETTSVRPESGTEMTEGQPEPVEEPTGPVEEPESADEPLPVYDPAGNAVPDLAFEPLLDDLRTVTSGVLMLPGELPEELNNVSIRGTGPADPAQRIPEYGLVFTGEPTGTTFALPPSYQTVGTLESSQAVTGSYFPIPEGFAETYSEPLTLSDGTEATLRYLEPQADVTNEAAYWQGDFLRDGTIYVLKVYVAGGEEATRQALSTMVEVPNDLYAGGTATPSQDEMSSGEPLDDFVNDYWVAVGNRDWAATYSYLSGSGQAEFTEEEWVAAQEARESESPTCSGSGVSSAEIADGSGAGEGGAVDVTVYCGDGTTEDRPSFGVTVNVVDNPGEYERVLGLSEIETVRSYL